jgi:DNA-binding CsgD family transcriptional regulator
MSGVGLGREEARLDGTIAPTSAVVIGAWPAFCQAVTQALARHGIEEPHHPQGDTAPPPDLTVLVLDSDDPLVRPTWGSRGLVVCCDVSPESVRSALLLGAAGVVDRRWEPDEIARRAIDCARGVVAVPIEVLTSLSQVPTSSDLGLSCEERCWLTLLAHGRSVGDVAAIASLSERELYRRLSRLYRRLGVQGREGAIALAARAGAIEPWAADARAEH